MNQIKEQFSVDKLARAFAVGVGVAGLAFAGIVFMFAMFVYCDSNYCKTPGLEALIFLLPLTALLAFLFPAIYLWIHPKLVNLLAVASYVLLVLCAVSHLR